MEKEVLFGTFDAFLISQMGFSLCGTLEQQEKIRKEAYHTFLNKIRGERPAHFRPYAGGLASEASLCLRVNRFSALPFPLGAMWSRQISILRRERRSRHFRSMITQK